MSTSKLLLFGSPRIESNGLAMAVDTRKALALAAYLGVTGQRASRDVLAALLWPDYDQARAALRRTLSVLNKALGEGALDIDRQAVGLNQHGSIWIDVGQFRQRLAECRAHDHPEDQPCPSCLAPLEAAAGLYRGDFLAGFAVRDSPEFDDWQFFQAEGLRGELASALQRLIRLLITRGRFDEAITHARRWLSLDSLHEPAHRTLIELYAWAGHRAAALRQYETCVRVLEQELGIAPLEVSP
ncbi:MAG TPA: BTAD domain-containing putative transcriptional regulator, partial [Chloroflexota bacterium]|nr:BTAD domain-containing putative transcriptional regulator [Chloroflexota bacterium]